MSDIIETIDSAVDDWATSADAMRWVPADRWALAEEDQAAVVFGMLGSLPNIQTKLAYQMRALGLAGVQAATIMRRLEVGP